MLLETPLSDDALVEIKHLFAVSAVCGAHARVLSVGFCNDVCLFVCFVRGSKLKDASVVNKFSDECLSVGEVVDVIIFELVEESILGSRFDYDWQDLGGVQLRRSHEVHLTEEATE